MMSDPLPPPPPTSLPPVLSRRWDESFLSRRRDESSDGCGRLGADDAGGSFSSSRALDRGSQLLSSSRVVCSVCCRSMPVTKAGLLRVHGPLGNQCAGSGMSTFSPADAFASAGASISDGVSSGNADIGINGVSVRDSNTRCARSPSVHPLFRLSSVTILKRIPHASRHLAASKLASILVDVTQKNDTELWGRLFNFSSRYLAVPERGGHRRSLASAVSVQLREESDLLPSQFRQSSKHHIPSDSTTNLAKRVSSKMEEGDVRGAVRIACSEDTLAELNEETLSALRTKHPPQPPGSYFPLALAGEYLTTISSGGGNCASY